MSLTQKVCQTAAAWVLAATVIIGPMALAGWVSTW